MPDALRILVVHGPNLNLLGRREPKVYGRVSLAEIDRRLAAIASAEGVALECFQSNHEGALVERIQQAAGAFHGIVINPAGLTFTSIPVPDALKMFGGPIIELHISNIHRREPIYHRSLVSPVATAVIAGLGARGYATAIRSMRELLDHRQAA